MSKTATDFVLEGLRKWGCPVHTENLYEFVKTNGYTGRYDAIRRQCARLAKSGKLRVLRPAVYSAFGPERD